RRQRGWHYRGARSAGLSDTARGQRPPHIDPRRRRTSMLLALDAGNTNVTIGLFDGSTLVTHWRLRTVHEQTADEWGVLLRNLFYLRDVDQSRIDGVIIASVVPAIDARLAEMTQRYFERDAL